MPFERYSLVELALKIIDNRGKTCPIGDQGIPLIATNCIKEDNLYPVYETTRYVSKETFASWFRGHPAPGDLIFVTKGSPGRVCMAPNPVDFCIAQDMVAIRPDLSKIYPKFLFALLRSSTTRDQISNMHVGTMIPHFKKGDFDKLFFDLPDRTSQEFIGDLHFNLCLRIQQLKATNATLEAIAQALFKSWFVDFDPVHAITEGRDPDGMSPEVAELFPIEFEEFESGAIPRGWRLGTLAEVIRILDFKRVPLSSGERAKRQGSFPYYGAATLMDQVDDYLFDGIHLLMGEDGSVANTDGTPILQYVWGKFWVNNHAHVLLGKGVFSTEHVMLSLKCTNITAYMTGAVQAKLNQGNLNRIPFIVPSDKVAIEFARQINPLFASIRSNEEQSRNLQVLRDTLLPRLMSGKLLPFSDT